MLKLDAYIRSSVRCSNEVVHEMFEHYRESTIEQYWEVKTGRSEF
jgi:hypothetical protein